MKAFVTGGSGFVGRHLIDALVRRGDDVTALVRSRSKAEPLERLGVRTLLGSLEQPEVLARAVPVCDVVYHVAGRTSAPDTISTMRSRACSRLRARLRVRSQLTIRSPERASLLPRRSSNRLL